MLVGAGTVLPGKHGPACILAGAEFIVCPNLNPDTIKLTYRYGKIIMPGTYTITEIVSAMELGADVVKFFPAA